MAARPGPVTNLVTVNYRKGLKPVSTSIKSRVYVKISGERELSIFARLHCSGGAEGSLRPAQWMSWQSTLHTARATSDQAPLSHRTAPHRDCPSEAKSSTRTCPSYPQPQHQPRTRTPPSSSSSSSSPVTHHSSPITKPTVCRVAVY
jgi:hypothetical protein